jgi:hypothetical protein
MLKTITWIGFVTLILGILIASISPTTRTLPIGLLIAGIGLTAAYLDALLTGQITFSRRGMGTISYQGLAGHIWGAEMVFIGVTIAFAAGMEWLSPGWVMTWINSPLGLAQLLLSGGLIAAGAGVVLILGNRESRESKTDFVLSLPSRLFGLVVIVAGLAVLGLGLIQLVSPGAIGGWIRDVIPPIPTPPVISE